MKIDTVDWKKASKAKDPGFLNRIFEALIKEVRQDYKEYGWYDTKHALADLKAIEDCINKYCEKNYFLLTLEVAREEVSQ